MTRRHSSALRALIAAAALFMVAVPGYAAAAPAPGSWVEHIQPIAAPDQPGAIALPVVTPLAANGPEAWALEVPDQRIAYNVSQPSLLPLPSTLPADQVAPAVLLVPGGGFEFLAMDNEGYDVARRLDRLGVRVFIVKYRTAPVEGGFAGFQAVVTDTFLKGGRVPLEMIPYGVADTQAALRLVRSRAGAWKVDPAKIGILSFSAGAIIALTNTLANVADASPDFLAMIYGPTSGQVVPQGAPPLFAALAADDRFFKSQDLGLIHAWRQAGSSVEFHLYSGGGHGFASHPNSTTSDAWFDQFALWLKASGITQAH